MEHFTLLHMYVCFKLWIRHLFLIWIKIGRWINKINKAHIKRWVGMINFCIWLNIFYFASMDSVHRDTATAVAAPIFPKKTQKRLEQRPWRKPTRVVCQNNIFQNRFDVLSNGAIPGLFLVYDLQNPPFKNEPTISYSRP